MTGQTFIAIDPDPLSGGAFGERIAALVEALTVQEGTRLPGSRRIAARDSTADGVDVPDDLIARIEAFI